MLKEKKAYYVVIISLIVNIILGPFITLVYMLISKKNLNKGDIGYGLLSASLVVGSILGALISVINISISNMIYLNIDKKYMSKVM